MALSRIRVHSDGSTELYRPHRYEDGLFKVFKRKRDDSKRKASGALPVAEAMLVTYLRDGFSLWMKGERGDLGLISPKSVQGWK